MFNSRTALVFVVPLACAALIACGASVGEDARITGESEEGASVESDPSAASPAPKPSGAMVVTAPSSNDHNGGGAASENAPSPIAPADAGPDAAPVPPKPSYSCTAPAMSSAAPTNACSTSPRPNPGGDLRSGTYYLSQWWSSTKAICDDTVQRYVRRGTMVIEAIDGVTYMRWTISGTTIGSGTARLTSTGAASLTREELCGLSRGRSSALDYWTSETDIVLAEPGIYEERWTKIPRTIDIEPLPPIDIKR